MGTLLHRLKEPDTRSCHQQSDADGQTHRTSVGSAGPKRKSPREAGARTLLDTGDGLSRRGRAERVRLGFPSKKSEFASRAIKQFLLARKADHVVQHICIRLLLKERGHVHHLPRGLSGQPAPAETTDDLPKKIDLQQRYRKCRALNPASFRHLRRVTCRARLMAV